MYNTFIANIHHTQRQEICRESITYIINVVNKNIVNFNYYNDFRICFFITSLAIAIVGKGYLSGKV